MKKRKRNLIIVETIIVIMILIIIKVYYYSHISFHVPMKKNIKSSSEGIFISPKSISVNDNNIYIVMERKINVYDMKGKFIKSYDIQIDGHFDVDITSSGDILIESTREGKFIYNNQGEYIGSELEDTNKSYSRNGNKSIIINNGDRYKLSNILGYTKVQLINKDGQTYTILKIKMSQWILKLLNVISIIILALNFYRFLNSDIKFKI